MTMKWLALILVAVLSVLSLLVLLCDAYATARARRRERPRSREGTYGVVVDSRGRVLGTYLDPFLHDRKGGRVHHGDSPWTSPGPEEWSGWAWEGFGATAEDARREAERLRRRYLQLLPWLEETDEEWRA